MQIQCLIIDTDKQFHSLVVEALRELNIGSIDFAMTVQDGLQAIHKVRPNLVFIRCGESDTSFEALFHVIKRLKIKAAVIPVITTPTKDSLAAALHLPGVVDLLAGEMNVERIRQVSQRALDRMANMKHAPKSQQYRAYAAFVGVTPTLSHRKILSETSMGLIHNRSLRLAIDYWRRNPSTPIAALGLNAKATFSSRVEEHTDSWAGLELKPWEIAMFEAQIFYMAYWREAIAHNVMPAMIPTLLQVGGDDLIPLLPKIQSETLVKIEEMTRRGQLDETLKTMGVSLRGGGPAPSQKNFADCLRALDQHLEQVDQQFPHLIRPSEETGFEVFKPDKASTSNTRANRMVFTERNRN